MSVTFIEKQSLVLTVRLNNSWRGMFVPRSCLLPASGLPAVRVLTKVWLVSTVQVHKEEQKNLRKVKVWFEARM